MNRKKQEKCTDYLSYDKYFFFKFYKLFFLVSKKKLPIFIIFLFLEINNCLRPFIMHKVANIQRTGFLIKSVNN